MLISQKGTVNGAESDDFGSPDFIPNLVLDGVRGQLKAVDAHVTGSIGTPFKEVESFDLEGAIVNLDGYTNLKVKGNAVGTSTKVYLPRNKKHNGVTCHIFNSGVTDIGVEIEGGK